MNLGILVPVFRNEKTIQRNLDSIESAWSASGEPSGVRVVIVIDGVVDGSIDVVRSWTLSTRLDTVVIVQGNSGIGAARNVAWRAASTEWVTFLDADDELMPDRLVFATGALHTNTVYVGRQILTIKEGLRIPGYPGTTLASHRRADFYLASMIVETSVLSALGGLNERLRLGDDWDLAVRLREHEVAFEYVERDFVRRHIHGDNASFDEEKMSKEYIQTIRDHVRRQKEVSEPWSHPRPNPTIG